MALKTFDKLEISLLFGKYFKPQYLVAAKIKKKHLGLLS
jgi:hypothetical protein